MYLRQRQRERTVRPACLRSPSTSGSHSLADSSGSWNEPRSPSAQHQWSDPNTHTKSQTLILVQLSVMIMWLGLWSMFSQHFEASIFCAVATTSVSSTRTVSYFYVRMAYRWKRHKQLIEMRQHKKGRKFVWNICGNVCFWGKVTQLTNWWFCQQQQTETQRKCTTTIPTKNKFSFFRLNEITEHFFL